MTLVLLDSCPKTKKALKTFWPFWGAHPAAKFGMYVSPSKASLAFTCSTRKDAILEGPWVGPEKFRDSKTKNWGIKKRTVGTHIHIDMIKLTSPRRSCIYCHMDHVPFSDKCEHRIWMDMEWMIAVQILYGVTQFSVSSGRSGREALNA